MSALEQDEIIQPVDGGAAARPVPAQVGRDRSPTGSDQDRRDR
jgi:hypothetical protein